MVGLPAWIRFYICQIRNRMITVWLFCLFEIWCVFISLFKYSFPISYVYYADNANVHCIKSVVTYFWVISQKSWHRLKVCLKNQFSLPQIQQLIPGLSIATLQKPVFVVISFMHWRYIFLLHRSTFLFYDNTDIITPVSQFHSSCLNINLFL